jgi:hypothetical protein
LRILQGSIALACLIKHIYGQGNPAINKQKLSIEAHDKTLATVQDFAKFKREHLDSVNHIAVFLIITNENLLRNSQQLKRTVGTVSS